MIITAYQSIGIISPTWLRGNVMLSEWYKQIHSCQMQDQGIYTITRGTAERLRYDQTLTILNLLLLPTWQTLIPSDLALDLLHQTYVPKIHLA